MCRWQLHRYINKFTHTCTHAHTHRHTHLHTMLVSYNSKTFLISHCDKNSHLHSSTCLLRVKEPFLMYIYPSCQPAVSAGLTRASHRPSQAVRSIPLPTSLTSLPALPITNHPAPTLPHLPPSPANHQPPRSYPPSSLPGYNW